MKASRAVLGVAHFGYDILRAALSPVGVGVRVMLVREGAVLLVYHSYLSGWHFPGGGVKRGETLLAAARREAYEETGAVLTGELRLLGIYLGNTRRRSDHTAVFACEDFSWRPPTDRWEITGKAFLALDQLPPGIERGYRHVVAQYRRGDGLIVGAW